MELHIGQRVRLLPREACVTNLPGVPNIVSEMLPNFGYWVTIAGILRGPGKFTIEHTPGEMNYTYYNLWIDAESLMQVEFKVGDTVLVKSRADILKATAYFNPGWDSEMEQYTTTIQKIARIDEEGHMLFHSNVYWWAPQWVTPIQEVIDTLQEFKLPVNTNPWLE